MKRLPSTTAPISPTDLVFERATIDQIIRTTPDGMFFLDVAPGGAFRFAGINPAMEKILGVSRMASWGSALEEHFGGRGLETLTELCERCASTGEPVYSGARIFGPPDLYFHTQLVPVRSAGGSVYRLAGIVRNTTPADVHLEKTHRLYSILSEVTQLVIRSSDSSTLLREVCRLGVERGGFLRVGALSRSGNDAGEEWAWGHSSAGPSRDAGASGSMILPLHDEAVEQGKLIFRTCTQAGLEAGCGAVAVLPVFVDSAVWGTLQFCSVKPEEFDEFERRMIAELAEDVGFALESIRRQIERKRMEADLLDRDRKTRSLLRLSQAMERAESFEAILSFAQEEVELIIGYRHLWFYLFDADKMHARLVAAKGGVAEKVAPGTPFATLSVAGDSMMEEIVAARDIIVVENAATDPRTNKEIVAAMGNRTIVNVPVMLSGRLLGSVGTGTFGDEGTRAPAPLECDYLRAVAGHMAAALDRIHLLGQRQRAEHALRESEERFATAFHRSPVAMAILHSEDGRFVDVNALFSHITGYPHDDIVGKTVDELRFWASVDDRDAVFAHTPDRPLPRECSILGRSGETRTAIVSTAVMDLGGKKHYLLSVDDVTDKIRTETEAKRNEALRHHLELELIQSQKLESLGTLASGIAHDFNNILGIILAHSSMAEQDLTPDDQTLSHLSTIRKATQRGASLVSQLLTFARKADGVYQVLDFNDIVIETRQFLSGTFPRTIDIITELDGTTPRVVADASQMHQVLVNLCLNARDAMPQGGTVRIATSSRDFREVAALFPKATARTYLVVSVTDTGLGMDEDIQKRMFDPFYTTKAPGKGSGLGLALVQSMIRSHHGFIQVSSTLGRGTTITLYLPAEESAPALDPQPSRKPVPVAKGKETILVVEDEEMLSDIVEAYLRDRGYTIMVARDGVEAIEIYESKKDTIDLVLSDIGLPLRSGEEVFREIISQSPTARVLLASGFIEPSTRSALLQAGLKGFIQKPYALADVAATVRRTLDTPPSGQK